MKNGFTLVELLAVIAVIALLSAIVLPSINSVLKESKDTIYQKQINNILNAAYDYSLENIEYLKDYNEKSYITLGELKYNGLIDADLKNTNTKENFEDNLVISIKNVGTSYKNTNENAKVKGNYLYTIEFDKLKGDNLKPKIVLNNLNQNSDGDYIKTINLNDQIEDINFNALSYKNIDITEKVKKYILSNDIVVDNIDTSKESIYKIHYSVIDEEGNSNASVLNLIIKDIEAPIIITLDSVTLNKNITNYNLLSDVSCEDNSNDCEIIVSGEVEYGVVGKYIIEYTAKDPSGNTSTRKKVITIE